MCIKVLVCLLLEKNNMRVATTFCVKRLKSSWHIWVLSIKLL
jgi:hypothetical protein